MKFCPDLFLAICLALLSIIFGVATAKPLAPVQVRIEPLQAVVQDQPVEFMVRATVSMDAENLQISVSVPASLQITSGELHWHGPLLKGGEKQLRFTAIVRGSGERRIDVRAFILATGSVVTDNPGGAGPGENVAQFSATAVYVVGESQSKVGASQALPLSSLSTSRISDRHGRKVAEYPLRP